MTRESSAVSSRELVLTTTISSCCRAKGMVSLCPWTCRSLSVHLHYLPHLSLSHTHTYQLGIRILVRWVMILSVRVTGHGRSRRIGHGRCSSKRPSGIVILGFQTRVCLPRRALAGRWLPFVARARGNAVFFFLESDSFVFSFAILSVTSINSSPPSLLFFFFFMLHRLGKLGSW